MQTPGNVAQRSGRLAIRWWTIRDSRFPVAETIRDADMVAETIRDSETIRDFRRRNDLFFLLLWQKLFAISEGDGCAMRWKTSVDDSRFRR